MSPAAQPPEQPPTPPGGPQQPGDPAPGPYPPGPWPGGPAAPPTAPFPAPGGRPPGNRRALVRATVAAVLMVAAVTAGAIVLVTGDDDGPGEAAASPSPTAEPTGAEGPEETADPDEPPEDPRKGALGLPDPVVGDDWQVAVNAGRGVAYDAPPEWDVQSSDFVLFVEREEDETAAENEEDEEEADGDDEENPYLVAMTAVALHGSNWCGDGYPRAATGVRTRQGAADTAGLAPLEAADWARALYDQQERATLEVTDAEPFTSEHGMSGHRATATLTDLPADGECSLDGAKVVVFSYVGERGDLVTWILFTGTGIEGEPDDETIGKIMNSLRPYQARQE